MGNNESGPEGSNEGGSIFDMCFAPSKDARQGSMKRETKRASADPADWIVNANFVTPSDPDAVRGIVKKTSSGVEQDEEQENVQVNESARGDNSILNQNAENEDESQRKDMHTNDESNIPPTSMQASDERTDEANEVSTTDLDQEEDRLRKRLQSFKVLPSKRSVFLEEAKETSGLSEKQATVHNLRMDVCMAQLRSETAQCVGRNALKHSKLAWPSISSLNPDGMPGERRPRSASEEETKQINKMIHALDVQLEEGSMSIDEYLSVVANLRPQTSPLAPLDASALDTTGLLSTSINENEEDNEETDSPEGSAEPSGKSKGSFKGSEPHENATN
ncbi:Hypothetical Protein FCC1311_052942 [Hondaea fermentalgiana]|uniref:Uncharacterized protein n=1 Tax=Hondaea fermentalgiana TaxID=2315210 RepID=A0A2R5GDP7_9STRA|nr:Hypothetical Protein FCC1311_052942 [Hondaea fermentalgiana]|eukprot:GBG29072.1 Hypothetical Protein FCC1311_052942 [Hondaea fermentalgiana]